MVKEAVIAKDIQEAERYIKKGYMPLSGGTELLRLNGSGDNKKIVIIKNLPLKQIKKVSVSEDGKQEEKLYIGSLVTFQMMAEHKDIPDYLKEAIGFCISPQKRAMATIGGNVGALRDDSYLIATLCACGAQIKILNAEKPVDLFDWISSKGKSTHLIEGFYIPIKDTVVKTTRYANTQSSHANITVSVGFKKCGDKKSYKFFSCIKNVGIFHLEECDITAENNASCSDLEKTVKDIKRIVIKDDLLYGSKKYRQYLLSVGVSDTFKKLVEPRR